MYLSFLHRFFLLSFSPPDKPSAAAQQGPVFLPAIAMFFFFITGVTIPPFVVNFFFFGFFRSMALQRALKSDLRSEAL